MKNLSLFSLLVIILAFTACQSDKSSIMEMELSDNWEFKAVDSDQWLAATVPGTVHTDLLANGQIEDPYYRTNERDLQWIDKKNWEYRTTFKLPGKMFFKDRIELEFQGLDTYAEVFLNDQRLFKSDNMFRAYRTDAKPYLKEGINELRIYFQSPIEVGLEKYEDQGYVIPVSENDQSELGGLGDKKVSIYTRKAGYHYGWDWGPRFVTSGIWRPVTLKGWNGGIIHEVEIDQVELTEESASMVAVAEVESRYPTEAEASVRVNGELTKRHPFHLKPGVNKVSAGFTIKNPKLWWPNGLGDPYLYNVEVRLYEKGGKLLSKKSTRIGLRTVEVIQEPDEAGSSFFVRVNGRPVFMKGANYIPQDNFLPRVTPERYEHILQSAADANMNMIRIWGGGVYEDNLFYDLCDEKGLLVWQDFMFACAMYPGDDAFLENVRQEAIYNVRRLRNHPSIALWCGNNENLSAWYNWGWKDRVAKEQGPEVADAIWQAYDTLFHKILPGVVAEYDPDRFYWSSSPSAGTGEPENWVAGDVHYWGVWWGQEPFSKYEELIPRFMSEFGFQSFPELKTIEQFAEPEDYDIFSEVMKAHQRSSIGNGTIANYMARDYRDPKDFESFLYVGQLLQADGIRTGIEAHRRNMPYCMGSLYWQIDDTWPVASWSSIDYYGNWKALHYATRKAFKDVLISPVVEEEEMRIYIVSDRMEATDGELVLRLMDFDGNILWEQIDELTISPNESKIYFNLPVKELVGSYAPEQIFLHALVNAKDERLSDNILYFVSPKELQLPVPDIQVAVTKAGDRYLVRLNTNKLAKNVYLQLTEGDGFFSDNYFDLLPGEARQIVLKNPKSIKDLLKQLKIVTLVDSYQEVS